MATYYIATTGNDTTGNGTSGTPWATLAKFLASSASGDTCICAAGTYTWATATINNRTIVGPGAASPAVFSGSGSAVQWIFQGAVVCRNIHFTNAFHVSNTLKPIFDLGLNAANVSFYGCQFSSIEYACDTYSGGFFGMPDAGATFQPYTLRVEACIFNDLLARPDSFLNALVMVKANSGSNSIVAYNNVFHFATTSGFQVDYVFYMATSNAVLDLRNNIFYNVSSTAVNVRTGATGTWTYDNNCAYIMSTVPSGTGNITTDPLFYDAANGNFNLRPTSPCLNTGTLV